ncbi:MAG: glucosaminidase domain-containing protein, partial [Bacilli bacterium]|nr:glucosaminidase domain-containing protein [Bacilli bacterium]
MNKVSKMLLVIAILLVNFLPYFSVSAEELSDCSSFLVAYTYFDADVPVSCHSTYNEALTKMNSLESTLTKVAVIKRNNEIINAKYALLRMSHYQYTNGVFDIAKEDTTRNLYTNANRTGAFTYFNGRWGKDAAFIDYNINYDTVKLKMSSFVGWTQKSNVKILPISMYYTPMGRVTATAGLFLRQEPNTTSTAVTLVPYNTTCTVYTSRTVEETSPSTRKWLYSKCIISGTTYYGYLASDYVNLTYRDDIMTRYQKDGDEIVHYVGTQNITGTYQTFSKALEKAPSYLTKSGFKYFSFDGNYFYNDILKMLEDYKNDNYNQSLNLDTPFYAYFQYLPGHSVSGYTKDTFDAIIENDWGMTGAPDPLVEYVTNTCNFISGVNRNNLSVMYKTGEYFIEAQKTYGVNAFLAFSKAASESAKGTSGIAWAKNNIFGMGASDSQPCLNARSYETVRESILDYAKVTGGSENSKYGYSIPTDSRYAGGHYGNKQSGMGVMYASDPYWGEKAASDTYDKDKIYGKLDYNANTLGIKNSNRLVSIYKRPDINSDVIYQTKRTKDGVTYTLMNVPFIVTDKVTVNHKEFYRVFTDPALDNDQKIAATNYSFDKSYGYVLATDLYVSNNQPSITATDKAVNQGKTIDLLEGTTASDIEDGNLTDRIMVDDSKVDYLVPGDYDIYYTVTDNSNFSKTVTQKLTVAKGDIPIIRVEDTAIPTLKSFDPKLNVEIISDDDLKDELTYYIKDYTDVEVTLENMIKTTGIYKIYYDVTDPLLNKAETYVRTVTVI